MSNFKSSIENNFLSCWKQSKYTQWATKKVVDHVSNSWLLEDTNCYKTKGCWKPLGLYKKIFDFQWRFEFHISWPINESKML